MFKVPLMDDDAAEAYAAKVAAMDESQFVDEIAREVLAAGYEARHGVHDQRCGVLYRESVARGGEHLYQRGYNRAAAGAGVEVDESDRRRAMAPA